MSSQLRQVLLVEGSKSLAEVGIIESGDVDVRVEKEHDLLGGRGEVVCETATTEKVVEPRLRLYAEASELESFVSARASSTHGIATSTAV